MAITGISFPAGDLRKLARECNWGTSTSVKFEHINMTSGAPGFVASIEGQNGAGLSFLLWLSNHAKYSVVNFEQENPRGTVPTYLIRG